MPSFRVLHISSPIRDLARLSPFDHPHAGVTDRFHLPCPHSPAAYLKSCGVPDNQTSSDPAVPQDYVSQLPTEISDRIFTLLDPSALDAARFTSRAWWDRIMGSHWILSRVLAAKHDHIPGTESWLPTKLGRAENLQGLPWRFNDSSILTVGWSAEYRKYTYDFALPEAPNPTSINKPRQLTDPMSDHHIVSADFSTSGKMMAFLVRGPPRPDLEAYANFSISLYCVFPPDPPVLIKSIACPVGDTPYRIQLVDVDPGQTWAAKVSCPSKTVSFSIWPRASFAKSASPYEVSEDFVSYDQGLQDRPGRVNQDDFMNYSRNDAPTREVHWRLLERLPSLGDADLKNVYLAEQVRSGGLFVVDFAGPVTDKPELLSIVKESVDLKIGEQRLRPVAFLSPPQHRSTFRNFAISKSWVVAHYQGLSSSRTLRIMIIWQSPPGPTSERPVLHTYGLGRRHNSDTFTSLRFDLQDRCSKLRVFESLYNDIGPKAEAQLLERPAKICCIQGERVSSIDVVTGGIYPANPCMNPDTVPGNEQCTGSDAALSGFEISPEDGDRCYVWGASASSSTPHVTLQVFDLRPGGNKRSEWWWWPDLEAYPMNCGCKLHDHGYRVTLPLAQTRSHCSPPTSFLQKLRGTDAPEILPDEGTVEHYNPPARAEALQRRGEGHKEIIRQLRRDGWSHGAIEEGWTGVQWTRRGCIPKPDGWREL